ncbi:RNA-binding (RRM/RBD/RNP motifs) family protein [Striga hermonthica]|uniref:RNA-binding (RRM/RBD/RNP motifs) family protein n=1 Tax=Striga hermonthica TaxID=68872 RepID=A0A9N7RDI9_STRHE|nr:RNA-binding (RRM/RBD/RNP motifs) family protein [Striga hermonthica]
MAFVAMEAATSIIPSYPSPYPKSQSFNGPLYSSISFRISRSAPAASPKSTLSGHHPLPPSRPTGKHGFQLNAAAESVAVEPQVEKSLKAQNKRKLFVLNLPWSYSVADIKKLFGECGSVEDVEIIKHKDGKNRGFAFVTMASGEEALAAIEKFDAYELVGRIIRVQFSKKFKKPIRKDPVSLPRGETRYKLYVSNLAWKVRSNNLRDLFTSSELNPVSARVVFDSPSGSSAGYGFVSFATKEEAESAISLLDGKELLGRPIHLKFSEKITEEAASESKEDESSEQQHKES